MSIRSSRVQDLFVYKYTTRTALFSPQYIRSTCTLQSVPCLCLHTPIVLGY